MLPRFNHFPTRYLRPSVPNTSLPLTLRPRIRQISNTNPLRPSQVRHIEDSLLDRLLDKHGINALIVLGGIVLPCLPFWWLEGRERERKDWISTLGAPSYKSWIKDTNLSSCQKDKNKERHFKKAFAIFLEKNVTPWQKDTEANYQKMVQDLGCCEECRKDLLDCCGAVIEVVRLKIERRRAAGRAELFGY